VVVEQLSKISTFQPWKFSKRACSNSADPSSLSRMTVTCLIAYRRSCSVLTVAVVRKASPIILNGSHEERTRASNEEAPRRPGTSERPAQAPRKLSYLEAREYANIEERITTAEQELQRKRVSTGRSCHRQRCSQAGCGSSRDGSGPRCLRFPLRPLGGPGKKASSFPHR